MIITFTELAVFHQISIYYVIVITSYKILKRSREVETVCRSIDTKSSKNIGIGILTYEKSRSFIRVICYLLFYPLYVTFINYIAVIIYCLIVFVYICIKNRVVGVAGIIVCPLFPLSETCFGINSHIMTGIDVPNKVSYCSAVIKRHLYQFRFYINSRISQHQCLAVAARNSEINIDVSCLQQVSFHHQFQTVVSEFTVVHRYRFVSVRTSNTSECQSIYYCSVIQVGFEIEFAFFQLEVYPEVCFVGCFPSQIRITFTYKINGRLVVAINDIIHIGIAVATYLVVTRSTEVCSYL